MISGNTVTDDRRFESNFRKIPCRKGDQREQIRDESGCQCEIKLSAFDFAELMEHQTIERRLQDVDACERVNIMVESRWVFLLSWCKVAPPLQLDSVRVTDRNSRRVYS